MSQSVGPRATWDSDDAGGLRPDPSGERRSPCRTATELPAGGRQGVPVRSRSIGAAECGSATGRVQGDERPVRCRLHQDARNPRASRDQEDQAGAMAQHALLAAARTGPRPRRRPVERADGTLTRHHCRTILGEAARKRGHTDCVTTRERRSPPRVLCLSLVLEAD